MKAPPSWFAWLRPWSWKTALITALATAVVVLLALNFSGGERRIDEKVPRLYESDDAEFRRSLGALLGPPLVEGNRIDVLLNGQEIFPAMLQAIRGAKRTVTFETFIYWSGDIGREFKDALIERARAGVKVHVLLDWVGSRRMDDRQLDEMKAAGVQIERFHPPRWSTLSKLNNRTHRKLLVVDGRVGFTGGVGIADPWQGDARNPDEWRDTHVRVEGPVVAQMQAVFLDNWIRATGDVLHGEAYFPALQRAGDEPAQMFSSSPAGGSDSMHLMYLLMITAARQSIDLSASYFVPGRLAVQTLADAARRGVRVRILTPGPHIDTETVRRASRAQWGPLLEAGVQIAEYQPTMFHVKALVIDGRVSSVGSTNFDERSFRLNDEANLNVIGARTGARLHQVFEQDWARSRRITLEAWRQRPWHEKLVEHTAGLLSSQL